MANDRTIHWGSRHEENEARRALTIAADAMRQKGYNPVSQISGYLMSGDPAYITNHNSARNLLKSLEREELLQELVRFYLRDQP
ncbi:IreB family regulatory phosphoprotein [Tumebacillus sp. ITR2]|uniref:IreB family regulatory phosphoprotein n=1 Tax=Tumebacillus amylolyticus TaxID=2801339 RepID=A0ABS1JAQ2_9BACL|nr:IreB family regulatory phosphoprotein [Tumebacillus amylolyticus]MBL0387361.1 IreB family regulatory phosphoprotein [Tumebacillus amylolyticus]